MKYLLFFALQIFFLGCKKSKNTPDVKDVIVSIESKTSNEGNTGNTPFNFSVKLNKASNVAIPISFTVSEGLAKEGVDYILPSSLSIVFNAGEIEKLITINVIGDDIKEGDEDFTINISSATTVTILPSVGKGNINNDDTRVPFANDGFTTPLTYTGLTLAWSDEFNTSTLNTNNWSYDVGDGCPSLCGWGNNELQYYNNSTENVFFQDGSLIIESKKQSLGTKSYSSGRIKTEGKKFFKFGRIDIRAISPFGRGIWPALFMMPQNNVFGTWPNSGEIDIMELKGDDPKTVYQTVHYGPGPPSTFVSKSNTLSSGNYSDSFHVYSLIWTVDNLELMIDNRLVNKITKADLAGRNYPFNEHFFFILCTAVGGNFPGAPDATSSYPQWLIVDYIRIFQ